MERKTVSAIPLSSTFFNPELMYVPGELDKFLVGLATQPRQKMDNVVSEQLTNHLFQGEQQLITTNLLLREKSFQEKLMTSGWIWSL